MNEPGNVLKLRKRQNDLRRRTYRFDQEVSLGRSYLPPIGAVFDIESLLLLGVDLPEHRLCARLGSGDGTSGRNSTRLSTRTVIHL